MSEWISVEKDLPYLNEIVLVCDELNEFISLGRLVQSTEDENLGDFEMIWIDKMECDSVPTHWMPLPSLPM